MLRAHLEKTNRAARRRLIHLTWAALAATAGSGCSAVTTQYTKAGYDPAAPDAVKRIAVIGMAPEGHGPLATLLAQVATDRINLKMNYLIYYTGTLPDAAGPGDGAWVEACQQREGILSLRAMDVRTGEGPDVKMVIWASLRRCTDGEILWSAEAQDATESEDENLENMIKSYVQTLGPDVSAYAAASFLIVRDILNTLPDPTLTDDEILEKIELGHLPPPADHRSYVRL